MFPKSIRWRVQLWHGVLLTLIVLALAVAFYNYVRQSRLQEIDTQLHRAMIPLLPRLAPIGGGPGGPPFRRGPSPPPESRGDINAGDLPPLGPAEFEQGESHVYYISWSPHGEIAVQSENAPDAVPCPADTSSTPRSETRTRGSARELVHRGPRGDVALVGTSLASMEQDLHRLVLWLTLSGTGLIAVGFVGGWWVTGRTLRPISDIDVTVTKIAAGDLSQRIPVHETESEIGQLAANLNKTFERLEHAFDQQTQFTADASHELRTPLTVMLTQIQLALSRDRSAESYRETLQTCERAAERMRVLVNSLLELARIDAGEYPLMLEECDVGKVAHDAVEFIQPLAHGKNATLRTDIQKVCGLIDAAKVGQTLINLLSNAIQHNVSGTEVCVCVTQSKGHAIIQVRDSGKGIPPEALTRIFDRFYRMEKSRVRIAEKQSSGLGLSICKAIVEAHGGSIVAESTLGKGTQFTVTLPLR